MTRSTSEEFAVLSAAPRVIPGLNHGRVKELQQEWSETLPQPYEQAVMSLDVTDLGVTRALFAAIECDTALGIEEKRALSNEFNKRRREAVHVAQRSGIKDLWI